MKGLNPKGEDIDRVVSDERFLQAAETLARLSIEQDLVPRNFSVDEAALKLLNAGITSTKEDGYWWLDRIERSGLLIHQESVGSARYVRLALDPLTESLAATSLARECGVSQERWVLFSKRLAEAGDAARGMKQALYLVCHSYADTLGWQCKSVVSIGLPEGLAETSPGL